MRYRNIRKASPTLEDFAYDPELVEEEPYPTEDEFDDGFAARRAGVETVEELEERVEELEVELEAVEEELYEAKGALRRARALRRR